jgi:hypothetical protein
MAVGAVAALALVVAGAAGHPVLVALGLAVAVALVRVRGRSLGRWALVTARFAGGLHAGPSIAVVDLDGAGAVFDGRGWTAVLEIDPGRVQSVGPAVPDPVALLPSRAWTLVVLAHPYQRVFVMVRVDGDDQNGLATAVARVRRRLAAAHIVAQPCGAADLRRAIAWSLTGRPDGTDPVTREAWDHLRVGDEWQMTIRMPATTPPSTAALARLAGRTDARIALAHTGTTLVVRGAAGSTRALTEALADVVAAGGARPHHPDGEQLAALRDTLPGGEPAGPPATAGSPVAAAPRLPPAGLYLGRDRYGEPAYLQLRPDGPPARIAVVGDPATATAVAARATTRVPVEVVALDRATAADAAALTSADLVICAPMPAADAAVVSAALGLGPAGEWLPRIGADMIAAIGDGQIRWLRQTGNAPARV